MELLLKTNNVPGVYNKNAMLGEQVCEKSRCCIARVRALYLECGVADLLHEMVHADGASLQAHQQLLALGSAHQLQVQGVTAQEVHKAGWQLASWGQ